MSSNRRNFLRTAAAAGGAAASASALAKASAARGPSGTAATKDNRPPFRLIWEGEWNDVPCSDYPLTPAKWAQESITPIVNTDVDALVYNLCSSDGYVAELENGERLLANVKQFDDSWIWRYRENTKRLIEAGANPPGSGGQVWAQVWVEDLPSHPHERCPRSILSSRGKRLQAEESIDRGRRNRSLRSSTQTWMPWSTTFAAATATSPS